MYLLLYTMAQLYTRRQRERGGAGGESQKEKNKWAIRKAQKGKGREKQQNLCRFKRKNLFNRERCSKFHFFADLPCFYFGRLRKQLWAKCVFFSFYVLVISLWKVVVPSHKIVYSLSKGLSEILRYTRTHADSVTFKRTTLYNRISLFQLILLHKWKDT